MTKKEKVLREQIEELEFLVEIKDEVIKELKSMITKPNTWPYTVTSTGDTFSLDATSNKHIPFTPTCTDDRSESSF